jgi:hypothetical protein
MPQLNPWALLGALMLAIAIAAGGYYEGWEMRGDHEAAVALKVKERADKALADERARGERLAADLEEEKRNVKTVTVEVVKEVPKVTTVYVEVPGEAPKAIPPAVITWGAVRLYNRALRPDLPGSAREFAYPPGGTDVTRAPVDTPDILSVHAENGGKYAECRAQLNKLIDFELGRGTTGVK